MKMKTNIVPVSLDQIPLVLRVEDIAAILNIGRSAAYELLRSNQIASIRIGRVFRVPKHCLLEYLGIPESCMPSYLISEPTD